MAAVEMPRYSAADPDRVAREYGDEMVRYARRIVWNRDDAEDAWQHALEMLVRRRDEVDPEWLVPWLRVVTRNQCLAILARRRRVSSGAGAQGEDLDGYAAVHLPSEDELCERIDLHERARHDLSRLRPQERRALALFGQGYAYGEIGQLTGWSRTKVNRCLTEGRAALRAMEAAA